MWRVSPAMKSKAEKCCSLSLKYPEVKDFPVIVSCSSSQWIFSSESEGRTMYWLNACRASWSSMPVHGPRRAGQGGQVLSRCRLAAGRSTALRPFPPRDPEGFELSFTVDAIP